LFWVGQAFAIKHGGKDPQQCQTKFIVHLPAAPEEDVTALLQGVPTEQRKIYLKIACRVFTDCGLPKKEILNQHRKTLEQCFIEKPSDSSDTDAETDTERPEDFYIKTLALFCAGPEKWHVTIEACQQFLNQHKTAHSGKLTARSALESLLAILANHGGHGIH
jgi:hypothetical protein